MSTSVKIALCATAVFLCAAAPVSADPPPWAPAYGRREKHREYEHEREHIHRVYVVPAPRQVIIEEPPSVYVAPYGISQGTCSRGAIGALVGAGTGAYIGSNVGHRDGRAAAIVAGGIIGALVGGAIGHSMDEVDQNCVGRALEFGESGQAVAWRNPDNDELYTVAPGRIFRAGDGRYCREYTAHAVIAGRRERIYGRACRRPDGTWQIMN